MPKTYKHVSKSKSKIKSKIKSKSKIKNKKNKKHNLSSIKTNINKDSLSLEDVSLLDFKKSKSFSVATTLTQYKSKSHIGEIYDYKPLHDKINNLCINKLIVKEPSLDKKNSKQICECIFDKNKDLSITELENRIKQKKDIPSTNCITILDKLLKTSNNDVKNSETQQSKKSKKSKK